jgi:hypothetical protein
MKKMARNILSGFREAVAKPKFESKEPVSFQGGGQQTLPHPKNWQNSQSFLLKLF